MGRAALFASLAFAGWVTCLPASAQAQEMRTGVFSPPRQAPDFTLRGSDGADFTLNRYRGKVVALGFGYTSCLEVCPTTLSFLAQARKKLGAAGKDLQVVYVTVDPERDNPEKLRKFVANFDPSFLGATGTPQQLADVRKGYGITITRKNIEGRSGCPWTTWPMT
jgi:protein SCO1/2